MALTIHRRADVGKGNSKASSRNGNHRNSETAHSTAGRPELVDLMKDEIISNHGSISFARFMELALYHPEHGYYMSDDRKPGRGGDFITSPEASPLFGHALARQMAEFWDRLGRPSEWSIREHGAGIGGLAYDIMTGLHAETLPAFEALTYRLAEINPAMREEARRSMTEVGLAGKERFEDPADALEPIEGVVLANEVADALPVHRLRRTDDGWQEMMVTTGPEGFEWVAGELSQAARSAVGELTSAGIEPPAGSLVDVSPAASEWFREATVHLERGFALIIDYGYQAEELYSSHRLDGTIRGYFEHTVTDNPLIRVGEQDLTAHVDFSALQRAGEQAGLRFEGFTTQGAFLSSLDFGDALMRLQADPGTSMEEYLATQAVVLRLIDPGGLGRFGVLIMSRGVESAEPLRGFRDAPPRF